MPAHADGLCVAQRSRDAARAQNRKGDAGVFRLRRNVLTNSDVGAIFMTRSGVDDRGDFNRAYGADANIRLPGRVDWSSFFINTETPGVGGPRRHA